MPLLAAKSDKAIFSVKVEVKVTKSLTLVSIYLFPIIFDARGIRPDMLRFTGFSMRIYVFIL